MRPGRNRCTFKNERTTPRPVIQVESGTQYPPWICTARQFCKAQEAEYRPVLYMDGSYREMNVGLRSVFDRTAVTRVASGSIVIMHAGDDWKERPIFTLGIRQGQDIQASSAFTMEYLALTGALLIQKAVQAEKTYTDCQSVYKILCTRREHLNTTDESH